MGVYVVKNEAGKIGYQIKVGGGLGRTPLAGHVIKKFLAREDLIAYLDAIMRVYNLHGRRDNKYKARIKILVKALTPEGFAEKVEAELSHTQTQLKVQQSVLEQMDAIFQPFTYENLE